MAARSPHAPWRKVLIVVLAVLLVLAVAFAGVLTFLVRRPLPEHSGEHVLPSLGSDVEVIRDDLGVPHIYASSDADLMAALGYVHAQDRFFEMDYRRHVTAGRLSELVGDVPEAIEADSVVRTLGWRRVAEQEWDLLGEEAQSLYEAYAEGVNAYISDREASRLGLEYTVLSFQVDVGDIEPWTPVDSLAWLKAMAWDLRGNLDDEIARSATLRAMFGETDVVDALFPPFPDDLNTPILPASSAGGESASDGPVEDPAAPGGSGSEDAGETATDDAAGTGEGSTDANTDPNAGIGYSGAATGLAGSETLDALAGAANSFDAVPALLGRGDGVGSNSFVISGEHTDTGEPILANDPHLSLEQPNIWFQVGLHCVELTEDCTFDVTGFSFAGLPGVVIGHNDALAWGLTNLGADVSDLTLERVFSDGTYLRGEERRPLERRVETILVNGADPINLEVLETEAGPIVSEVLTDTRLAAAVPVPEGSPEARFEGYSVALQWTALTPGRTGEAIFALNRARDAEDVAAAAEIFEVPSQNIVFATTDGDIGYQAPGRIPIRADVEDGPLPSDGSWPRPGWDERYEWQGFIEPADLPAALNPDEGFIVAANQSVLPNGADPFLTADFDPGYRAERIRDLIEEQIAAGEPFTVESAGEIMNDDASAFGPAIVPYLLDIDTGDPFLAEAVGLLADWADEGYPADADSAGAAYFYAVWGDLLDMTFGDEIPEGHSPDGGARWLQVVTALLEDPDNPRWDDRTTVNVVESRDEILSQALTLGRYQLTARLGKNPADWRWGDLHTFAPQHPVLGGDGIPALVRDYVNPEPQPAPGGTSLVNALAFDTSARDEYGRPDYVVTTGPSMRMVVDMSDLDASTWVTSSGTSGHPASGHYTDQQEAWLAGESFPWAFSRGAVEAAAEDTMILTARRD